MSSSSSPTLESSLPDTSQDAAAASVTAQSASNSLVMTRLLPNELKREILRFCDPATLAVTSLVSLAFLELSTPILHDEIEIRGMSHLGQLFCSRDGPTSPSVDACLSLLRVRAFTLCGRGTGRPSMSTDRFGGRASLSVRYLRLFVHRPKSIDFEWAVDGGVSWSHLFPLFDPLCVCAVAHSLRAERAVDLDSDAASDAGGDVDSSGSSGHRGRRPTGGCPSCGDGGHEGPCGDRQVPELDFAATSWSRLCWLKLAGTKSLSALGSADFAARGPDPASVQPLEILYTLYKDEDPDLPSEMFKSMWNDLRAYTPSDDLFSPDKRSVQVVICGEYNRDLDRIEKVFEALLSRYRKIETSPRVKRLEDIIVRIQCETDGHDSSDEDLGASEAVADDDCKRVDAAQTQLAALEI